MTAITGSVRDVTGVEDNETPWSFASVIRFADDGSVITEKPREVRAVSGTLKVNLVPGYAIVTYGKHVWQVDVPETPTTLKALIEAGVAFPPDASQALLDAAVGQYVEANREQFRTRAVPVVGDPTMAQWVDENGALVGDPVPWSQVISEEIALAAVEAEAPAAVGQAAADMNPVPVPGPTPGKIAISFNGTTGDEFNPLPASWIEMSGKPATVVHASAEEGIPADGTTNVSSTLGTLINTIPAGSVLQLEEGDYYAPTLRNLAYANNVTIRGVPGKTRIVGDASRTTANYSTDVMVNMTAGSLHFENVAFEDSGIPVGFKDLSELGDISFSGCDFIGCNGVIVQIYDPTALSTRLGEGKTLSFRNFRMSECRVYDCDLGVLLNTTGGWESIIISDNVFNDVGRMGVWAGFEYSTAADRNDFQPLQGRVVVHDNVFRNVRPTDYTVTNPGANAILAMGEAVTIHDNIIDNVDATVWDDCEGIYTKARYADIHDNILINAGGMEAAIMMKGVSWDAETTLDASMDGLSLPQSTLTVASTEGFGYPHLNTRILVESSSGWQTVSWTGKTETTITGVSGGTGTLSTGGAVRGEASDVGSLTGISSPNKCHDNIIVFTKTDRVQRGIGTVVSNVHVYDNEIVGATGNAIGTWHGCVVERNIIRNHHGTVGIQVIGNGVVVEGNKFFDFDGSYTPGATSLICMLVRAETFSMRDVVIKNNTIRNTLAATGLRTAASAKLRAIQVWASGGNAIDDIAVIGNRGRNLNIGLTVTVADPVSNLKDIDNDWANEDATTVSNAPSHASPLVTRSLGRTVQTVTGSVTLGSVGDFVVFIGSGGAPILPTAVGNSSRYSLKNTHTADRSIATTSSQTIDGAAAPLTLPPGATVELVSDGANWRIF